MSRRLLWMAILSITLFAVGVGGAADDSSTSQNVLLPVGSYLGQDLPGDIPVVFAPGVISTGKEHSAAMFTPDGKTVWFGRMFPARIYYMTMIDEQWSAPRRAPIGDTFNDLYPVLSPDGSTVFFTSDRPNLPDGDRLPRSHGLIWMIERTQYGWTEPHCLDTTINFGQRQSCGSVATSGNLYFSAKEKGRRPGIYCSHWRDSSYATPRELTEISSTEPQHCPVVAPDESYLIFSSFRGGLGRSDLFISFRRPDGTWSAPRNMGPGINSAYKDEYPYVTPDGKYLFFNSNRPSILNSAPIPDGPGNIYWVSAAVIEELRE